MLGRKSYTRKEYEQGKAAVEKQLIAYKTLAKQVASNGNDKSSKAALEAFEARFFNNMTLVLDRYYVHRLRVVTGKDGNPLNEVEMIADSLMNHNGVLQGNNVIKYVPDQSVVKLNVGDQIRLTAEDFERLSAAFFADLERKFL